MTFRPGARDYVQKVTWLPISPQLAAEASAFRAVLDAEMELMERELHEWTLDQRDGPRFGPGRNEYDRIMAPIRKRQALRAHAFALMPGKRPGQFVRRWECTAEDHPAPFFCRECGARLCCCRCRT